MNDAQPAPGASLLPDSTGLVTGIHLVVIALFAVAAVAIILIGIVRKRRRDSAEHVVEERIEQAEAPPTAPVPSPPPAAEREAPTVVPEPLSPSPVDAASIAAAGEDGAHDPAAGPVTQLKGLGPRVAARLAELGINSVGQLAALSDADAARLDAELGPFTGRMARDRWLEQARLLAAGDRDGFEAAFGRL